MLPVELTRGKKVTAVVEADEGIYPTTAEGLARLRPVLEGGTVTFGAQTHPAWGHPQAPTGLRAVAELIEELADGGGGVGLFSGCAAGDTAMAVVLRVTD